MMLFKVICDCRFSIEIYDYFHRERDREKEAHGFVRAPYITAVPTLISDVLRVVKVERLRHMK